MLVPLVWLNELCDPQLDARGVERTLTMTGTKVEAVHRHGVASSERLVVGRVEAVEPHGHAERLHVCRTDVGDDRCAQIVCAASNVAVGQLVAVALPGAVLPDGRTIAPKDLRGVTSHGMLLADDELALGLAADGVVVLDDDSLVPGTALERAIPGLATDVLELEVTPNRPDCLSVAGVARELHAATGADLAPAPWAVDAGSAGPVADVDVVVEAGDLCPRFTARLFEDVTVAPSPPWLKARLVAAGQRPINNVVDITNYVMLLTGQPLHAFDLDRVVGQRLVVRRARDGERVRTLDGQERILDEDMVVIDDAAGPTSIAGVKGGARSEVKPDTTRVLVEAANWSGSNIHRTAQRLALRSESSGRFEKGLAPEQCLSAQAVATQLIVELCGARICPGTIDIGPEPPAPETITLRSSKVDGILGVTIPLERQTAVLRALGFGVQAAPDGLDVTVPPQRRNDVTREADLVEEVARFHLDDLAATLPSRRGAAGTFDKRRRVERRAADALVGAGADEAVGWSFTDPGQPDRLRLADDDPRRRLVILENPMSDDQAMLRSMLLGSLLDAAAYNAARGNTDVRLFERGTVFERTGAPLPDEKQSLAALIAGRCSRRDWLTGDPRAVDFYAAKALLACVLDALRVEWRVIADVEPFLRPGRSARVLAGPDDEPVGWIGELHPTVAGHWDLDIAAAFEIELDRITPLTPDVGHFTAIASVPSARQDIAVVIDDHVAAADVQAAVREAGGDKLADVAVFDVYRGPQIGYGRKSLGLALTLQAHDRTLADADIAPIRARIIERVAAIGGELR